MGWPGPMTSRQYATWKVWMDLEMDQPDLVCMYLMQIAQEVRRVLSSKPGRIKLKDFHLQFETQRKSETTRKPLTVEEATKRAQAKWLGMLRLPRSAIRPPPEVKAGSDDDLDRDEPYEPIEE